jgi:hypothetical protein
LLRSVQYEQATGQLIAELVAKKITVLETLQKELSKSIGLTSETNHISESPSTTDAFPANMRLTLKPQLKGVLK